MASLYTLLFPDPPRQIPAHRALSIAFRTAHLATFGALLGGHVFGVDPARLLPFLLGTIGSGAALMAIELASTFEWFLTVKGVAVLLKLVLLVMIPLFWNHRVSLLLIVVVVASVSSHMPSRFRHYRLGRGGSISASPKFVVDPIPQGGRARRRDHSGAS